MPRRRHRSDSSSSSSSSDSGGSSSSSSRSPLPKSRVIKISSLTGNVNRNHLFEIFENYGKVEKVSLAEKKVKEGILKRGHAYIKMEHREDAAVAKKCMNGGWIDGNQVRVKIFQEKKHKRRRKYGSRSHRRSRRSRSRSGSASSRS